VPTFVERDNGRAVQPSGYDLVGKRVWVAGHDGMVGRALVGRLRPTQCEVLTVERRRLDLRRQRETEAWMAASRPHAVFVVAATVGGIQANAARPGEFLYDNLLIAANIIDAARRIGVEKLLYVASSAVYPRAAPQPMREDLVLTGPLEPTHAGYAVAKIAGIALCQAYRRQYGCDFISVLPTNVYGPGGHFDAAAGHVVPSLIAKAHAAKTAGADHLGVWGSGEARREFLYVDDLADALVFLMRTYSAGEPLNVGTGEDLAIRDLALAICDVVGFTGTLTFDAAKPDGPPRKLLDVGRLTGLGWRAKTPLAEGLARTYRWYLDTQRSEGA
jgi:GDP-L-fucose synthase